MPKLVITKLQYNNKTYMCLAGINQAHVLEEFLIYPFGADEEGSSSSLVGRIYAGKVENIASNIQAAFVRIRPDLVCFLPLSEGMPLTYTRKQSKRSELCAGDEILVQVVKDAVKTKQPVLSTSFSVAGRFHVLTSDSKAKGVSRKIPQEKASELKELLYQTCEEADVIARKEAQLEIPAQKNGDQISLRPYGIILRTQSRDVSSDEIRSDLMNTILTYQRMSVKAPHAAAYTCIYQPETEYIQKVKGIPFSEIEEIVTDQSTVYEDLCRSFPNLKADGRIRLYTDQSYALSALYGLQGAIEELTQKRVWLKSGANIIIEQLETLTFIDVNTAKNVRKQSKLNLSVNKEAAAEIARQLHLRNISGMIIIDFINMEGEEENRELIRHLKEELKKDSVTCTFADITKLGLVELTRRKVYKSLKESLL